MTPGDIAQKMVWYLGAGTDDKILEPQGGTGNLVRALLSEGVEAKNITTIERHHSLVDVMEKRFKDQDGLSIVQSCFLDYTENETPQSFDRVLMNPPFKKTKQHIEAALKLLKTGGSLVALVPVTFDPPQAIELEKLSNDTFASAKVFTKIILIEKAIAYEVPTAGAKIDLNDVFKKMHSYRSIGQGACYSTHAPCLKPDAAIVLTSKTMALYF